MSEKRPDISQNLACHPSQVQEFNKLYRERGITCAQHLPNGDLEYSSRKSRNAVMKSRNLLDRDAGYGDWNGH